MVYNGQSSKGNSETHHDALASRRNRPQFCKNGEELEMTICVGWVRDNEVFLIADSAVTRSTPATTTSSLFGERHENRPGLSVEESALKIFRWQETAAAFAGDADLAREIFQNYITLAKHSDSREAFEKAWISSTPFETRYCAALFAFHDGHTSNLIKFDVDSVSEQSFAAIGALDEEFARSLETSIREMPSEFAKPDEVLHAALAFFQRNSVFSNLMPIHIGGYYAGIWITRRGLSWAYPSLHAVFSGGDIRQAQYETPDLVFVNPVGDMVFVRNNLLDGWTVFSNSFGAQWGLTISQLRDRAHSVTPRLDIDSLPMEYMTIYDIESMAATVLRLNGAKPSPGIHVRLKLINGEPKLMISCSQQVVELLKRKPGDGSIAYHDCRVG